MNRVPRGKYNAKKVKRLPKIDYFKLRLKEATEAGMTSKAAYFQSRIDQLNKDVVARTRERVAAMSPAKRIKIAAGIINDPKGGFSQQQKQAYLMDAGLTDTEYYSALDLATNGALLRAAGVK